MKETVIDRIYDMGLDHNVTIEEIDSFVDECISFLRHVEATNPGLDLVRDIFELEDARQNAIRVKFTSSSEE